MAVTSPAAVCAPWAADLPCKRDGEEALVVRALTIATWVVWGLSGRQYGLGCPVTVRPCLQRCDHPWLSGHVRCSLREGVLLDLGRGVHEVDAVTVDGDELPAEAWRLQEGRWLRRVDGQLWPAVQDFTLPAGEVGTWSVTYKPGTPPPDAGVLAVEVLGCEVLLALRPEDDGRCKLPRRTRTVARQSVAIELIDPATFLEGGRTGLPEVDLFVRVANPTGSPSPPRVWSPDYDSRQDLPRA